MTSAVVENVDYRVTQLPSHAPNRSKPKPLPGKKSISVAKSAISSRKLKHDYKHHKYPPPPPPPPHYTRSPYYYHPYYYPYPPPPWLYHHHHRRPPASVSNNKTSSSKPKSESPSTSAPSPSKEDNVKSIPPKSDNPKIPAKKQCNLVKKSNSIVSSKKNADKEFGGENREIHKESAAVKSQRIADKLDVDTPFCYGLNRDKESSGLYDFIDPLDLKLMSSAKFVTFKHIGDGLDDNGHCLQKNKTNRNTGSLQSKGAEIIQSNAVDFVFEDTNPALTVNDSIESEDRVIDISFHSIECEEKETTGALENNDAVYNLDGIFRTPRMESVGAEPNALHDERIASLKDTETNVIGGEDDISDNFHFNSFICSLKSEDEEHSLIRHPGAFSPMQWLKI